MRSGVLRGCVSAVDVVFEPRVIYPTRARLVVQGDNAAELAAAELVGYLAQ